MTSVKARTRAGIDASEASADVLQSQIRGQEPLGADERRIAVRLDTRLRFDADAIAGRLEAVAGLAKPCP